MWLAHQMGHRDWRMIRKHYGNIFSEIKLVLIFFGRLIFF